MVKTLDYIFQILYALNFAVNFLVYYTFGKNFRHVYEVKFCALFNVPLLLYKLEDTYKSEWLIMERQMSKLYQYKLVYAGSCRMAPWSYNKSAPCSLLYQWPIKVQVTVFLSYTCSFLSVWCVVCVTIDNYIRLCHPSFVKVYCKAVYAIVVIGVLLFISLCIYHIPLWATGIVVSNPTRQ
jgi:hypothetical protein